MSVNKSNQFSSDGGGIGCRRCFHQRHHHSHRGDRNRFQGIHADLSGSKQEIPENGEENRHLDKLIFRTNMERKRRQSFTRVDRSLSSRERIQANEVNCKLRGYFSSNRIQGRPIHLLWKRDTHQQRVPPMERKESHVRKTTVISPFKMITFVLQLSLLTSLCEAVSLASNATRQGYQSTTRRTNGLGLNNHHVAEVSPEWHQAIPPYPYNGSLLGKKIIPGGALAKGNAGVPLARAHSTGLRSLLGNDGTPTDATLGGDLRLAPELVGLHGSTEDSSGRLLKVGSCLCWNTTEDGLNREVECKCTGEEMTSVGGSLPPDIHRLSIEQAANFTTLGNTDLRGYGESLNELVLSELGAFETIKNGTFLGMKKLRTIYIHGTPALTQISDAVFNVFLPELKIIRITHSALEVVPNLSQLHIKGAALHMVEFENNNISRLIPGSFKGLTVEHLALSYNSLEEIGPSAFSGSTIARLTLKGNPLRVLHPDSFVGIDSLRVLDLSETKITYLPTQGLSGLESLRLQKVWTLSVIPSIYHFQELREAHLTFEYHCCAFEYPETHDPQAFQKYQDYVRNVVNELCAKASANNGSSSTTQLPDKAQDWGNSSGHNNEESEANGSLSAQRHKRHLRLLQQNNALKQGKSAGLSLQQTGMAQRSSTRDDLSNHGRNIQDRKRKRDNTRRNLISNELSSSWNSWNGVTNPAISHRLERRSVSGTHPRHVQQWSSEPSRGSGNDDGESISHNDGFHHPHVHHHVNVKRGGESGDNNPIPFDNDDSVLHFGGMKPKDAFDPFVFDPDQSFAPLEPNDLERESDIRGKDSWGTFGHGSEAEFDEENGIFHPSVTPSPTVITLCGNVAVRKPNKIRCDPLPDAFNPCEDIMGSVWLRGAVWVVVALSLLGNSAVLVVLLLAPGSITVQRFLMANLSWADLCMGIYLMMVATKDLVSLGSYFNYAIDWQLGWGCKIAGFLTVFASELSVFTLAIITGERWYALTRAIHLTKRLTLLGAGQLMAFGWFLAILLASLPLMGVSSYSKTSICLPMEASSGGAIAYLIFLLLFNGVAFLLVACAYWQMYRAVAGHGGSGGAAPAASSADTAIAKKMALLVFTDFACWAPVAFFGLTAVGGMPLIGVTDAKILLVFFYPLNACCNPYLYAILTKQYRRDLLLLLSRHGLCAKRAARYKSGHPSTNNTMQTMQTILRMGSMTETKVAGVGGARGSLLVNGNGRPSLAPTIEDEGLSLLTRKEKVSVKNEGRPEIHEANSRQDSKKGCNGRPRRLEEEEDDAFDINGLNGRHIVETAFISVPLPEKVVDPSKEKLIRHVVEQHHCRDNGTSQINGK